LQPSPNHLSIIRGKHSSDSVGSQLQYRGAQQPGRSWRYISTTTNLLCEDWEGRTLWERNWKRRFQTEFSQRSCCRAALLGGSGIPYVLKLLLLQNLWKLPFSNLLRNALSAAFSKDGYEFAMADWGKNTVAGRKLNSCIMIQNLTWDCKKKARDAVLKDGAEVLIGEEGPLSKSLWVSSQRIWIFSAIGNAVADSFTIDNYDKIYPNTVVVGGFSTNPWRNALYMKDTAPQGVTVTVLSPNYVWGWIAGSIQERHQ